MAQENKNPTCQGIKLIAGLRAFDFSCLSESSPHRNYRTPPKTCPNSFKISYPISLQLDGKSIIHKSYKGRGGKCWLSELRLWMSRTNTMGFPPKPRNDWGLDQGMTERGKWSKDWRWRSKRKWSRSNQEKEWDIRILKVLNAAQNSQIFKLA